MTGQFGVHGVQSLVFVRASKVIDCNLATVFDEANSDCTANSSKAISYCCDLAEQ